MLLLHLQKKAGGDADSTVEEEIADNLYLLVKRFINIAEEYPILVMDNIKIQANIEDDYVMSRYGDLYLPAGCRLRIPTYSPDFNQVAEHTVACVKQETKNAMYVRCSSNAQLDGRGLQHMVEKVLRAIKSGELYNVSVARNVMRMPFVWQVIGSSKVTVLTDPRTGRQYNGTEGNWAPPGLN